MKGVTHKILFLMLVLLTLSSYLATKPANAATPSKVLEILLNEGSGITAHDSSNSGNNANISGASWVRLSTGKWVLDFNGQGNSLSCNYSLALNLSGTTAGLTLETWVKVTVDKSALWLGNGTGGSSGGGYALYYNSSDGTIQGYIEGTPQQRNWYANVYDASLTGVGTWHYVVYTYDGQNANMYVDGNYQGSAAPWTGGIFSTSNPFQVNNQFAGMIGKIGVYNYAIPAAQIGALYQSERGNYSQLPTNTTIYVYPTISDTRIVPNSIIPNQYISNNISINGSPGEYRPASFAIYAPNNISAMTATISDLNGPNGTIGSNYVDIRVVKVWYQAGVGVLDTTRKQITPELLLKNDSLVQIQGTDNYIKYTDGSLHLISGPSQSEGSTPIVAQMPIQDASSLQPVDIPATTNKQFWVTANIPNNAVTGNYSGTITLTTASGTLGQLRLQLQVLPIQLSAPYLTYSAYYTGFLDSNQPQGSISDSVKSESQLNSEMIDMKNHGVTNPTSYQPFDQTLLGKVLALRNNLGMGNQPFYYLGLMPWGYEPVSQVQQVIALAQSYGVPSVYFYGVDEATGSALTAQRGSWQAIRAAGGKMFVAGWQTPSENFASVGDLLDLFIYGGTPSTTETSKWHSIGHQIFCYNQPQFGVELPKTYRRNYGLLLWQQDYDGAMDFAYQYGFGNIWNDFDSTRYRDHVMAYPTINGVIDTIQWEGFREGVNDVRYLTTLKATIATAKAAGKNTSAPETWLAALKTSDLATQDLDAVRSTMINYILALQATQAPALDHITVSPSNPSVTASGNVTFSAQGYDSSNNPISGLTYTWNVTNNGTAGSINSSGLFTAGTATGSYTNVIQAVSGNKTGNASVTVTAGVLHHITVSPSNPSVAASGNATFSAQGYDSSNNPISGLTYTWSVTNPTAGSINSSGLFSAGTILGSYANAIQAVSGNKTGTASVTVIAGVLHHIAVSPSNPSVAASGNVTYSAQGFDSSNNPITGLTYIWSTTNSTAGSINSSGLFTAGITAGSYPNVIQAVSGNKTGATSVTVTQLYPAWDINQDGATNVLDMIRIGQHMGESGSPGWIPEDVNRDGVISVLDSIVIGQHWTG